MWLLLWGPKFFGGLADPICGCCLHPVGWGRAPVCSNQHNPCAGAGFWRPSPTEQGTHPGVARPQLWQLPICVSHHWCCASAAFLTPYTTYAGGSFLRQGHGTAGLFSSPFLPWSLCLQRSVVCFVCLLCFFHPVMFWGGVKHEHLFAKPCSVHVFPQIVQIFPCRLLETATHWAAPCSPTSCTLWALEAAAMPMVHLEWCPSVCWFSIHSLPAVITDGPKLQCRDVLPRTLLAGGMALSSTSIPSLLSAPRLSSGEAGKGGDAIRCCVTCIFATHTETYTHTCSWQAGQQWRAAVKLSASWEAPGGLSGKNWAFRNCFGFSPFLQITALCQLAHF